MLMRVATAPARPQTALAALAQTIDREQQAKAGSRPPSAGGLGSTRTLQQRPSSVAPLMPRPLPSPLKSDPIRSEPVPPSPLPSPLPIPDELAPDHLRAIHTLLCERQIHRLLCYVRSKNRTIIVD